jgi:hypothetical protein
MDSAPHGAVALLTIGQLATYAGVTVRAVRHYHQIGLGRFYARLEHTNSKSPEYLERADGADRT